jgi:hypothetical protein
MAGGMIDHGHCRRATWHPGGVAGYDGEWRCYKCGEPIAKGSFQGRLALRLGLVPVGERDGLPAFGLPLRTMAGRRDPHGALLGAVRGFAAASPVPLPVVVYCPLRGVCGVPQHLHPSATVRSNN